MSFIITRSVKTQSEGCCPPMPVQTAAEYVADAMRARFSLVGLRAVKDDTSPDDKYVVQLEFKDCSYSRKFIEYLADPQRLGKQLENAGDLVYLHKEDADMFFSPSMLNLPLYSIAGVTTSMFNALVHEAKHATQEPSSCLMQ